MLSAVPNPRILIAPLSSREAVLSSKIEGTKATMGEVIKFEAGGKASCPARRDDCREVVLVPLVRIPRHVERGFRRMSNTLGRTGRCWMT